MVSGGRNWRKFTFTLTTFTLLSKQFRQGCLRVFFGFSESEWKLTRQLTSPTPLPRALSRNFPKLSRCPCFLVLAAAGDDAEFLLFWVFDSSSSTRAFSSSFCWVVWVSCHMESPFPGRDLCVRVWNSIDFFLYWAAQGRGAQGTGDEPTLTLPGWETGTKGAE